MAWGILLLFGGGIALANALEAATLMDQLGQWMASFSTNNTLLMVLIVTTVSVFLSEVMSNVAQVIVIAPVISSLATALHMQPLMLGIAMTLGAKLRQHVAHGNTTQCHCFCKRTYQIKRYAENRICNEHHLYHPRIIVLLFYSANGDETSIRLGLGKVIL